LAISFTVAGVANAADDLGLKVQQYLNAHANQYFGIKKPIASSETVHLPRAPLQSASDLIKLAHGLSASIVSRKVAENSDMMAFYYNDE
jgi:hypothetical protein